ncbi:MAG: SDR family NAD(P)-dependent oxidoreductase [Bdellovibrionales bacterium]|jgi:NADP-dependent 3-hydroxy acid dehydrogenase YdfG|nr:SDR family NAD(P)-dependent oxidoreductase [Bdellovibrionales bacterium]
MQGSSKGTALVTGASAGIGAATAETLSMLGFDLVLTARRSERLQQVAQRCRERAAQSGFASIQVQAVELDVTNRGQIQDLINRADLAALLQNLTVLVNNAGLARGRSAFHEGSPEEMDEVVETNILGLLHVTRAALPLLLKQAQQTGTASKGHIVNIGSVAGRWTYPGGTVYCATKAAVRAISEGLRMDLSGSGVRVTNIAPGMVETEFSKVRFQDENVATSQTDELAKAVYAGMTPLSAQDIAECIAWAISRPAHVNIQEMIVYPTDQAGVTQVHREK